MLFSLFSKRKEEVRTSGVSSSLHDESTQKIVSKPPLRLLESSVIKCPECARDFNFSSMERLSISHCPLCSSPVFIPQKIKDFWLYEPLGGGGMGSVYHAFHKANPDAEFAIKILPRELKTDRSLICQLMNEAFNGAKFGGHPHIARVFDYGSDEGEYYAAYEYINGIRLDQIIDSPAQRPLKQLLLWVLQLLSAEQHIYDCGFLYRDLKPQNIIIDKQGNLKLIDFGLAIKIEDSDKEGDEIQGSPYYMPPERIIGKPEGQFSEIYSMGMVLFHLIAKQPYYSAEDIRQLVGKHVVSLRINNVAGKLPHRTDPEIIRIINKMIDRSPNSRYQTYKELGKEMFDYYRELAA